jgi:hypothetical protein
MDRRALLALVGCGVGTAATGRTIARADCPAGVIEPTWVFPVGDYRVGIDSSGDRPARLIVLSSGSDAERSYAIPAIPHERRLGEWLPLRVAESGVDVDSDPSPAALVATSDAEVRLVFDPEPGVTTYAECSGVGLGGKAYVAATVVGTGPTYLVRLDPATGAVATATISRRPRVVLAVYRRPGQNAIRIAVADGAEIEIRGSYD